MNDWKQMHDCIEEFVFAPTSVMKCFADYMERRGIAPFYDVFAGVVLEHKRGDSKFEESTKYSDLKKLLDGLTQLDISPRKFYDLMRQQKERVEARNCQRRWGK